MRPGAPSRLGEAAQMQPVLEQLYRKVVKIEGPGTIEGGDILVTEQEILVGRSARTDAAGIAELTSLVAPKKQMAEKSLISDHHGHGGKVVVVEGVLMWLKVIYGIDLKKYDHQSMTKYDLKSLAEKICQDLPNTQYPD